MRSPNIVNTMAGNVQQDPDPTHQVRSPINVEGCHYEPGDLVDLSSFVDRVVCGPGMRLQKTVEELESAAYVARLGSYRRELPRSHKEVRDELRAEAAAKAAEAQELPPAEEAKTESKPRRQRG